MVNFLAVTWDVDPVLFRIGNFEVLWYGLSWALALGLGGYFFSWFIQREKLNPDLNNIFWWGAIVTIVGSRLGHCLFYDPVYYLTHPIEFLYFRQGGMASHGAAIGLLLGLWAFARHYKLPFIWIFDRIMIPVTLGGAIVRMGNLINSEIYGHTTDLPWGFIFVRAGETLPKHPTQIYEALCYLVTFAVLVWLYYRKDMATRRPGLLFGVGLIGIFLSRFLLEFIKNLQDLDPGSVEVWLFTHTGLNTGQLLSLPFIVAGMLMVLWPYSKYKLTPSPNRWSGLRHHRDAPGKKR